MSNKKEKYQYLIYLIEDYKYRTNMDGKDVVALFDKYGILNYVLECYEALHTLGFKYVFDEINNIIKKFK